MFIFQDLEKAKDKKEFIYNSIQKFRNSNFFIWAIDAENYYAGENTTILARKPTFYGKGGKVKDDIFRANNRVCNEFFPKIVRQLTSYLLSNGLTIDNEKIKLGLGKFFDIKLQKMGNIAQINGVAWAYTYLNDNEDFSIQIFKGTEGFPLYDEETGVISAFIRFWQIESDRPLYCELYEIDGKTKYKFENDGTSEIIEDKKAYIQIKEKNILEENLIDNNILTVLPVIPMYYNDIKKSAWNIGLKSKNDLYDIIDSDFGNELEDCRDVYWILKNYEGQDIDEFIAEYKHFKTIKVDSDGDAEPHTIEVPYEARKIALDILRKDIYEDSMALDTSILSGGSLTNVAIKANMANLDLKTDDFENEVYNFLYAVIDLFCVMKNVDKNYEIELKRRTLLNDTEVIDNLVKMENSISQKTYMELNPYIKDPEKEIQAIEKEGFDKYAPEDNLESNEEQ